VLLNLLGILPASKLASWWRQIVFGVFLFAAVATPTGDPLTMTSLAAPLCLLILGSYFLCRVHDARARDRDIDYGSLSDDETSPLDTTPTRGDDG
jgi:sec-independent protein translocase protein TatC